MSTKTLIDRIVPYAQGWDREGTRSIIKLIEQGQDELFAEADQNATHFIPSDNQGFPPYLKTVADTYRYNMTQANIVSTLAMTVGGSARAIRIREIKKVFVDATVSGYADKWIGEPFIWRFTNNYGVTDTRLKVAEIPCEKFPALESDTAYLTFFDNPETANDKYFLDGLYEPARLTSESIPLFVPQRFEQALEEFVIGKVQFYANKSYNALQERFEKVWKPEFKKTMRQGGGGFNGETVPREC
jgi:hypothetical protein